MNIKKMGDISVHVCGGSEGNDHCAVTRKTKCLVCAFSDDKFQL